MAFAVLASTGGGQAQAADMSLEFRNVEPDSNRNPGFGFSGGVWTDPSGNEDVVGRHNFSTDGNSTNPDIQGTPIEDFANDTGGNGVIAGQWGFTVTGSSYDRNWVTG
jgi:hypothetical protein